MTVMIFRGVESAEEINANYLPVGNATPQEVIDLGILSMSLATLYRTLSERRFYAVIPTGNKNGRVLPLWQFSEPVPELLPRILKALYSTKLSINAFLVSECESLNELSPAEVIAGKFFADRPSWHPAQERLLGPPGYTRQEMVLKVIDSYRRDV